MKNIEYTIEEEKIPEFENDVKGKYTAKMEMKVRKKYNLTPDQFELNYAVYVMKYKK